MKMRNDKRPLKRTRFRHGAVLCLFLAAGIVIGGEAVNLQYFEQKRLLDAGADRQIRTVTIPAGRGDIVDRNDDILALSIPAYAVWVDPQIFNADDANLQSLSSLVGLPLEATRDKIHQARDRRFVYLRRGLPANIKERLQAAHMEGVGWNLEYRRHYPMGEAAAHVLGLTDVDGRGLEGMELAFEEVLKGQAGERSMLCDISGRPIEGWNETKVVQHGQRLKLALDSHIQYRTWRTLKDAIEQHDAVSGSAVMLDTRTGDVLALVNYPGFNPGNRNTMQAHLVRNRAAVDSIEPGSTIKPFVVAMLLDHGHAHIGTGINTSPGYYRYKDSDVRDVHDYGYLTIGEILVWSSNVGISKLVQRLSPETLWTGLTELGFNSRPLTGLPGEASGALRHYTQWSETSQVVLSYGYGMRVSLLQLARAYAAIAADGMQTEINLIARPAHILPKRHRVFSQETARHIKHMLTEVVKRGTGKRAQAHGYTTAGKTGTIRKHYRDGYSDTEHASLFAGFAPATDPRIALVVMIDEPGKGEYFGGVVAAPVFSKIVTSTLRYLRVPEDEAITEPEYRVTRKSP